MRLHSYDLLHITVMILRQLQGTWALVESPNLETDSTIRYFRLFSGLAHSMCYD